MEGWWWLQGKDVERWVRLQQQRQINSLMRVEVGNMDAFFVRVLVFYISQVGEQVALQRIIVRNVGDLGLIQKLGKSMKKLNWHLFPPPRSLP